MLDTSDVASIYARSGHDGRPPVFKAIGISLAVASGVFIGISFVLKKIGLLRANVKYNEEAGEGYGYLKNAYWWGGMTLMILGEICNFVAYAFVDAILVTPLGALSVVITTILSAIFLKERLSFVGKVGCFNCIIGSVVIAMNAPEQSSVSTIQDMKHFVITPGFLTYAGIIIVGCAFVALWAGPRYGKKSMFVYISICSLIGGLSVVATQGLGAAIIAQISGTSQFKEWFLYVLFAFVIATLLTEIIYLNKALNIFNAALVTPTYYVFFTSATIITSAVLFQGFKGSGISIATVIMGFLQICAGVVLLQLSKSAKDVPDAAIFKGDLDQVREVVEQEVPESEPKADTIRGAASIVRRISSARHMMEKDEARRYYEDRHRDEVEPLKENEIIEWDGLRRRRTVIGESPLSTPSRRMTVRHPPLGMSKFPDFVDEDPSHRPQTGETGRGSIFSNIRGRASTLHPYWRPADSQHESKDAADPEKGDLPQYSESTSLGAAFEHKDNNRDRSRTERTVSWADDAKPHTPRPNTHDGTASPPHIARRQFSFQNVFRRLSNEPQHANQSPNERSRGFNFGHRHHAHGQRRMTKNATEEETLGLVKGDSSQSTERRRESTSSRGQSGEEEKEAGKYYSKRPTSRSSFSSEEESTTTYAPHHQRIPSRDNENDDENYYTYPPDRTASPETIDERPSSGRSLTDTTSNRTHPSAISHSHPPAAAQLPRRPLPALPDEPEHHHLPYAIPEEESSLPPLPPSTSTLTSQSPSSSTERRNRSRTHSRSRRGSPDRDIFL